MRWRRRVRRAKPSHAFELGITSALVIGGIYVAGSDTADSTKISLVILLGSLELLFVFSRVILRELNKIAARTLSILPDDLPETVFHHLDHQRLDLMTRARRLSGQLDCELEKHEMYAELIGLTDSVTEIKSGSPTAAIYAISSKNVEDFQREPLAREYLDANRRAVERQVTVRRIFLLDAEQAHSGRVRAIIKMHDDALTATASPRSGVKWILKANARDDQDLDFALFAHEVLVRQAVRPGGIKFEMTVDDDQVNPSVGAFDRLWERDDAHPLADFEVRGMKHLRSAQR